MSPPAPQWQKLLERRVNFGENDTFLTVTVDDELLPDPSGGIYSTASGEPEPFSSTIKIVFTKNPVMEVQSSLLRIFYAP